MNKAAVDKNSDGFDSSASRRPKFQRNAISVLNFSGAAAADRNMCHPSWIPVFIELVSRTNASNNKNILRPKSNYNVQSRFLILAHFFVFQRLMAEPNG